MENLLPVCEVCGEQAMNAAQDLQEVPNGGPFVSKIGLRNWRGGCAEHPAKSKTFWLNGTVTTKQ
jgi:hypothetical protein